MDAKQRYGIVVWARQTRYRARQFGLNQAACPDAKALLRLIRAWGRCAFCVKPAAGCTLLVPLHHAVLGPVPANIVPACAACRKSKRDLDIVEWWDAGGIDEQTLVAVVRRQLGQPGGEQLRQALRLALGCYE